MVHADFSGNYTNPENCRDGDIGVVIGEGYYEDKKDFKGKDYKQLSIEVEVKQKKLIHSLSMPEGKRLVKSWNSETKEWIGKKFICRIVNYKSLGQTKQKVEIEPVDMKV